MKLAILLLVLFAFFASSYASAARVGIGTDGRTLCKYCPLNCGDLGMFMNCPRPSTYWYGCDIRSPCLKVTSASAAEIQAGIAFCIVYRGCWLTGDYYFNTQNVLQYVSNKVVSGFGVWRLTCTRFNF